MPIPNPPRRPVATVKTLGAETPGINPYAGKTLRALMAIRRNLERSHDGPIPAWTDRAWRQAYHHALSYSVESRSVDDGPA